MQVIIGLVLTACIVFGCWRFYNKRKGQAEEIDSVRTDGFQLLLTHVKTRLSLLARDDDDFRSLSAAEYDGRIRIQEQINESMDKCVYGIPRHCSIIRGYIRDIVASEFKDYEALCKIVDFRDLSILPTNIKWEVLIYYLNKSKNLNAAGKLSIHKNVLSYLVKRYDLDTIDNVDLGDGIVRQKREFSAKKLDRILQIEQFERDIEVTYPDALDLMSILLFQRYAGLGVIDSLRYMDLDGFNFGTSGIVRVDDYNAESFPYKTTNSVWVQNDGTWIHYSFLDFGNEREMARVINQLTAYGTGGQMVEKKPYTVVDDFEGSRITACRPPCAESWGCFVRKFNNVGTPTLQFLLHKNYVSNAEIPDKLIQFLMKARQTCAFTGGQNTGKTTLMKAGIAYTPTVNIRVLEMAFELALRSLYPDRNIYTVKPSDYVSSSQLQDLLKKTDGWLSITGEVSEDIIAARMIQFTLIGTDFTMFSHHGKDDNGLVNGLANSLVACKEYPTHEVALTTVLNAVKHNIHLGFVDNKRVLEYISEIEKEDDVIAYPEIHPVDSIEEAVLELAKVHREFATRVTDRVKFRSRYIVKFNVKTMSYEPGEFYSEQMIHKIMRNLSSEDRKEFLAFFQKYWHSNSVPRAEVLQ